MNDYDAALKMLLTERDSIAVQALSGWKVKRWHSVDLPRVKRFQLDLLGEISGDRLLHIELQSRNDPKMAVRMHDYGTAVMHKYGKYPEQLLIYAGRAPMQMPMNFRANSKWVFRYEAIDLRNVNGKKFLISEGLGDNILAILADHRDARKVVHTIVDRIAGLDKAEQPTRLEQLVVLAGLRKLFPIVQAEASRMPITEDILDHELIGPAIRKGQQRMLRRQIRARFGTVPRWLEDRMSQASAKELDALGVHILKAKSLEDLKK